MRIKFEGGEPVQYLSDYKPCQLNNLSTDPNPKDIFQIKDLLTKKLFQLIDSDLFDFAYYKSSGETTLFLKFHHLIADGWALAQIIEDVLYSYLKLKNNEMISEEPSPSYLNHIAVEEEYQASEQFLKDQAFWQQKINTIPEFIYFKNRPAHLSYQAQRLSFLVDPELFARINRYCKARNLSIFVLFTTVFSIYIQRTTSKKDLILGTTVLNRANHQARQTVGMYINTLPIRLTVDPSLTFDQLAAGIYAEWKSLLRHQRYPNPLLLKTYRQVNRVSDDLFDVTINYQNAVLNSIKYYNKVKVTWHPCGYQTNSLNIHLNHRENSDHCEIDYDYLTELFTESEIECLHRRLLHILEDALDHPLKPVAALELMAEAEQYRLLQVFNQTESPVPSRALHQLVETQAAQDPGRIAVIFEERTLTYRDLNEQAGYLAAALRRKGVGPGQIVGLLARRSPEMIVGMLGILKAGAAYLPLDGSAPRQRIEYMLRDSGSRLLLSHGFLVDVSSWKGEIVNFDQLAPGKEGDSNPPAPAVRPEDLAYVIYTSGSTGQPKGVLIEHGAIVNTVHWRKNHYHFTPADVLLQIPPCNFDSSVEDIFTFLSAGAAIVLVDEARRLDLIYLRDLILRHRVSHFLATPLLYQAMLDEIGPDLQGMTSVTVAGENFHLNLVKKHFQSLPEVKLYNEYGPTENSVCSTVHQFSPSDETVVIGKPISNCHCYVLNEQGRPQPLGVPGELYLGGAGLARGYMNNPALTQEKFVFFPQFNQRLYKTGDLVKWTLQGELQFIERMDHQVKLRGFRIELGEIEFHLLNHPAVREALVTAREEAGHKYLCAYFISGRSLDPEELKIFLSKYLPDYMVPAYYVRLAKFPLTPNGKIDHRALPEPEHHDVDEYLPPQNKVEARLVALWQEVLGVSPIGTQANVFELGGDSLAVIRILAMSYADNWGITVQDFYKYPTIKTLAAYIRSDRSLALKAAVPDDGQSFSGSSGKKRPGQKWASILPAVTPRSVKHLLLTGASGFLGMHLLVELLKQKDIRITALVRERDSAAAKARLWQLVRFYFPQAPLKTLEKQVTVLSGDIGEARLGLTDSDYHQLYQRIDTVLHGAALVKHYGHARDFQRSNVDGVRQILQFCENKYLMYISTTSIAGDYAPQSRPGLYFDETCLDIGQCLAGNDYVQSKLEAEKLLDRHLQAGLEGTVIRVGNLTGRYSDGGFQHNIQDNKFYQVLKAFIELGSFPASLGQMVLEFTPVDLCAQAIVRLLRVRESGGRRFHLCNPHGLTLEKFSVLLKESGYPIQRVNDSWFQELLQKVLSSKNGFETLRGIIPDLTNGRLNYGANVTLDCQTSVAVLNQLDFVWPRIDHGYLGKILSHMHERGFIQTGGEEREETV